MTSVLVSEGSQDQVLEAVADALRQLVPYHTLSIYRADAARRLLYPVLVRDRYAAEILALGPLPFGVGIVGHAAERSQAELVNDVAGDPRAEQIPGTPIEPEALVAVPLRARGELKGVLALYRLGEEARFDLVDVSLATRFAAVAALAIDNADIRARLESEVITDHLTELYNHRYFYERLAEEMRRVHRAQQSLGLLVADIDDFKLANDRFGHSVGDRLLRGIASAIKGCSRAEDVVCRIGGEEFALILPITSLQQASNLAERIRSGVASTLFPEAGTVTLSIGVAAAPAQASSPRELFDCADAALRAAKAEGKDRVRAYSRHTGNRRKRGGQTRMGSAERAGDGPKPDGRGTEDGGDMARLRVVRDVGARLSRLLDVTQIGSAITAELRSLIDYHNCRVYLLSADGDTLVPVAFRGDSSAYPGETVEVLTSRVGEGITGRVVASGESLSVANARHCEFAVQVPGTPDIDESILAVPLRYGPRPTGAIVLSALGVDQFDDADLLLLETLASHAAVAFENARLYQVQVEAADIAQALLGLSERLTEVSDVEHVLAEALEAVSALIPSSRAEAWMRSEKEDTYQLAAHRGYPEYMRAGLDGLVVPASVADPFIGSITEPFVIPREALAGGPPEFRRWSGDLDVLGTPMHWGREGLGGLAVVGPNPEYQFTERDLRLARGISNITSLALANAFRFDQLERTYLSTVEALANALEAQDEYTSDHARVLAEMAVWVGGALDLGEGELKELKLAALFHDIGKIGVPSEIIRKPGPLTAEERRAINRHPEIGEQILAPIAFLDPIRPVVRACHERFDGKGYPDGLAGERIPLAARIVFVCDAYHAMTTTRPYRGALPEREAIKRLKLSAGTQFDPAVVKTFVDLHAQGILV